MQLNVPFSEIPESGIECDVIESSWFPKEELGLAGPVAVHIRLTKKSDNRIEVKGNLQATVLLQCDRCLQEYTFQVDSPMQLVIEVAERDEHWKMQELEITEAELETITVEKPVAELGDLFRQQLLLAIPEKKICGEQCAGLCPRCGANLNEQQCECSAQPVDSPFAVLKGLKK